MKSKRLRIIIILGLLILAVAYSPGFGGETALGSEIQEEDTGPMAFALNFFRKTVSRADGRRCMMYPSCSHYSSQALKKHGFIKGWVMTSDRLLRCGRDEKHIAEQIIIDNHVYVFDHLPQNDFWWNRP